MDRRVAPLAGGAAEHPAHARRPNENERKQQRAAPQGIGLLQRFPERARRSSRMVLKRDPPDQAYGQPSDTTLRRIMQAGRPLPASVKPSGPLATHPGGTAITDEDTGTSVLLEELSHGLRSPLTSLITYLSLLGMRFDKAAREGDLRAELRGYAELEAAALADALRMGAELDRLLARRAPSTGLPSRPNMIAPEVAVMGDRRFDRLWEAWDARLKGGERQFDLLKAQTEHGLAEMLAADAGANRRLERNVIATELTNRLAKRQRPTSDALVAAMARGIARASQTSSDTRRLVADSALARAQGELRRAGRAAQRDNEAGG